MHHLDVPAQFQRNSATVLALGVETTGANIIDCGNELLGWPDLSNKDVLDIGCGVRFTQTIINRAIPIKSYTGIDIDASLIDFLSTNVHDARFAFHYWHVYNEKYNRAGRRLSATTPLPLPRPQQFDLIWMYSVITHTYPHETECLLTILRRYVKRNGGLVFSALLDPNVAVFEDRIKDQPLGQAYYSEPMLQAIIAKTGWRLEAFSGKRRDPVMQNLFLCRPQSHLQTLAAWALRLARRRRRFRTLP